MKYMMKESQFCIPVHNPLLCFPHHVNKRPQPSVQTPLMAACSIYKVLEREREITVVDLRLLLLSISSFFFYFFNAFRSI